MGLLTDPNTGQGKMSQILINHNLKICVLLYFCGVVWFLCLAHKVFNGGTYFSENALLPGLVRGAYDEDLYASKIYNELEEEMNSHPDSIPYSWFLAKFRQMNIDAHLHSFTLDYPLKPNTTFTGKNIYAVVRASRSASWEGVVISAPYRTLNSIHPPNKVAIALMMSLAKFCRRQKYWAKDIIFLITDHEQLGAQAWLDAYHGVQSGSGILKSGSLPARAGALQAAINLEFHSTKISHIDVKIEGLNGQLPNLDLVNLVHRLCHKEGIQHTFKNRTGPRKSTSYEVWKYSLHTLMSMVLSQATGTPNGNHGLFHRFGIQAVTLEAHAASPKTKATVAGLFQAGRVLEGILRSLNNLLEKFHQSFFFYLLVSRDRYISIGLYTPAVGLAGFTLLVKALSLWLEIYKHLSKDEDKDENKPDIKEKEKTEDDEETMEDTEEMIEANMATTKDINFSLLCMLIFMAHIIGLSYIKAAPFVANYGYQYGYETSVSVYCGYAFIAWFSLAPFVFVRLTYVETMVVKMIALLELTTLLLTICMINFSLGFLLTLIYVPVVLSVEYNMKGWRSIVYTCFLFLIHSFALLHITVLLYTWYHFSEEPWHQILSRTYLASSQALVYINLDNMIYGSWFNDFVFGGLTSNWLLFWILSRS